MKAEQKTRRGLYADCLGREYPPSSLPLCTLVPSFKQRTIDKNAIKTVFLLFFWSLAVLVLSSSLLSLSS